MTIDTGAVGEKFVDWLASRAGFTSSKCTEDKEGWDFVFQRTPGKQHVAEPLDRLLPQVTCFVQVKATVTGASFERVKLSNWARMAKSPVPWFFIRVVMDQTGEPRELFLIHVDQHLIRVTMNRLAEFPDDAEASELSRRTMRLTWDESHRINPPFYSELGSKILECVGDMHDYTTRKSDFVRTVGYGEAPYSVVFRPRIESATAHAHTNALADFSVGLLAGLAVSIVSTTETRFGRRRPAAGLPLGDATIAAPNIPSLGKTTVTIEDRQSNRVTLACDTYVSSVLLPKLPKKYQRARFVSPSAEIVISGWETARISWRYPAGVAPLSHFAEAANLLRVLASSSRLTVSFKMRGKKAQFGVESTGIIIPAHEVEQADIFIAAEKVAREYRLDPSDVEVDGDAVVRAGRGFKVLAAIIGRTSGPLGISLTVAERDAPRPGVGDRAGCVVPTAVRLGDRVLAAVMYLSGTVMTASAEGEHPTFTIENAEAELPKAQLFYSDDYDKDVFAAEAQSIFEERAKLVDY